MAAILYPTLFREQKLHLLKFYTSRIRRVYPALFVLCLTLILLGSYILSRVDYYALAKEIRYAGTFLYNIKFHKMDYFDDSINDNWLIHTWTLALEFQFYLLFPFILWMGNKIFKEKIIYFLLVISAASFLSMLYFQKDAPQSVFFLLQYRIWEFLLGSILFIYQYQKGTNNKYGVLCNNIGFIALILFFFFASEQSGWPDYKTLIPVLSTILILYANQNTFFTKHYLFQRLGDASYSIYLWHWPFYIACVTFSLNDLFYLVLSAIASVVVAFFSYYFIERSIKSWSKPLVMQLGTFLLTIGLVSGLVGVIEKKKLLLPFSAHLHSDYEFILPQIGFGTPKIDNCLDTGELCVIGDESIKPSFILIGDSHAASLAVALEEMAKKENKSFLLSVHSGCPLIFNQTQDETSKECLKKNSSTLEILAQYKDIPAVILNRYSSYLLGSNETNDMIRRVNMSELETKKVAEGLRNGACKVAKQTQTYWVSAIPEIGINVPETMMRNIFYRKDFSEITIPLSEYQKRNQVIISIQKQAEKECGIEIIDISSMLCDKNVCHTSYNQEIYYGDDDHLNIWGARKISPLFEFLFD
ncbi:hypothetical protein B0188_06835 [[Haemophilus] felis]|uniref:Acyltransferase n=1 Tax=[Haemophilus] felis TaxID=123822 RepID=A0A1T0AZG8_9PAST|nr:hypothetical protein B0188_06835 [[Haemophilus] felis]